jgi:hypothetical protein
MFFELESGICGNMTAAEFYKEADALFSLT